MTVDASSALKSGLAAFSAWPGRAVYSVLPLWPQLPYMQHSILQFSNLLCFLFTPGCDELALPPAPPPCPLSLLESQGKRTFVQTTPYMYTAKGTAQYANRQENPSKFRFQAVGSMIGGRRLMNCICWFGPQPSSDKYSARRSSISSAPTTNSILRIWHRHCG